MKIVLFTHSLVSDWNHGNAHFLRGVVTELLVRGHEVTVYEPRDGWSLESLRARHGEGPIRGFHAAYPGLGSLQYDMESFDVDAALDGAELVVVHEWNAHDLVRRIGAYRRFKRGCRLLFHDTHHRSITDPAGIAGYDLRHYDGVLAYGNVIRDIYLTRGWAQRAWTWHEAADTRVFRPLEGLEREGDLVWIGNWGDDERTVELRQFLFEPVRSLGLRAQAFGVRYPEDALAVLSDSGVAYRGWLPNYEVPGMFARFRVTVHIPRRPYVTALPGIPTIRPFEALACGIPLVCSPWEDTEGLFTPGKDYLLARNGGEMRRQLQAVLQDDGLARELSRHGRSTILARHTCAHRVEELLAIRRGLDGPSEPADVPSTQEHEGRAKCLEV